ncbi:hypothetical protein [uncultured Ilyobacter sp.]|uniref:hypothetical protein n=1 Tax=uncultured Ilyobacter sp. TaxID=544433 RepID=UPI0029C9A03D|nr:hypothetical protein [uncultured Ilyobacter sp.]
MNKEILEFNGKQISLMKQPASFIANLERKYTDRSGKINIVAYVDELLKYPAGVNPALDEIITLPEILGNEKFQMSSRTPEGKINLFLAWELFSALFTTGRADTYFVGEMFIKKLGKQIDIYSFVEIEELGGEIIKQVANIAVLTQIRESFRKLR